MDFIFRTMVKMRLERPVTMRAVIFVNGLIQNYAGVCPWLLPDDYRIAADGGLRHLHALALEPHALVGDLDSVEPADVAKLAAQGVTIERHRPEKDKTDLELAIEHAAAKGATEIILLGALGGRLDQTVANLLLLAQRDWPAALSVVEEQQVASVLRAGQTVTLTGTVGTVVSLIPLSPQVTGITYTGLKYLLSDYTLPFGSTRGVSNELAAPMATIRIGTGLALIVQEIR
jgi:thiamine pyrophosphokinase